MTEGQTAIKKFPKKKKHKLLVDHYDKMTFKPIEKYDEDEIEEWRVDTAEKLQKFGLIDKITEIQDNLLLDCVDGGYYSNELDKIKLVLKELLEALKP